MAYSYFEKKKKNFAWKFELYTKEKLIYDYNKFIHYIKILPFWTEYHNSKLPYDSKIDLLNEFKKHIYKKRPGLTPILNAAFRYVYFGKGINSK